MKRTTGFTLIELLAVIVVLGIIMLIAVTSVSGIINNSRKESFKKDAQIILKNIDYNDYINNNESITTINETNLESKIGLSSSNYQKVEIIIVDTKPYIIVIGNNKWNNLMAYGTYDNMNVTTSDQYDNIKGSLVNNEETGANKPLLATGMTPIKWDGTNWVTTTENDTSWYDYPNKVWANARTNDGSMWVWIPRYAYQIATGYHTATAGTINIKFLQGITNTSGDSTTIYEDSATNTHFVVHPAFTFGSTQLTGFWVAKFEMSGTTSSLDSKPNVPSLRSLTLGNMFIATRNMETNNKYGWGLASGLNTTTGVFTTDTNNIDTHVIKSSEWGAITYLAHSTYGKNSEIYINPSFDFITGRGGNSVSQAGTNDTFGSASAPLYGYDGKSCLTKTGYVCTGTFQSVYGMASSTTGNIYGIYDMSGGACEYTMGNYNNSSGSSGLTPGSINSKYINIYSATGSGYDASNYGDAIYETSSATSGSATWYSDSSAIVNASSSWFGRGGYYADRSLGGTFNFYGYTGAAHIGYSWRSVVALGTGF